MPKLEEEILVQIIEAMFEWEANTLNSTKANVNHSWPVQVFGLLRNIKHYCPAMENFTYDLRADPDAQSKGFKNIWRALAYYMAKAQGVDNESDIFDFVRLHHKSVKSGISNLQAVALAAKVRLYASSHDLDGKNINVITFDGGYDMAGGKTISETSDYKDGKRWRSFTTKSLERKHNGMSSSEIDSKVTSLEQLL